MPDEKQNRSLTRRAFSGGMLSAAAMLRGSASHLFAPSAVGLSGYAYVGTRQAIHAFDIAAGSWQRAQVIEAAKPIHLELHPFLPMLYVIHKVDLWDHLPRGAVSTYSVDQGLLRHEHTQPLSLSATFPLHGKVSRDGQHFAVAAGHGGIYNLLPVRPDGSLGSPTGIIKDFGSNEGALHRSARPSFVAWHPDGVTLLTSDLGNGRLNSLVANEDSLERTPLHHGIEASHFAVRGDGGRVYALHARYGSIHVYEFDPATKKFSIEAQTIEQSRQGPAVMASCEQTNRIVAAGSGSGASLLTSWQMDDSKGGLVKLDQTKIPEGQGALCATADGERLFGVSAASGVVTEWQIDRTSGRFSAPIQVAQVAGAYSLSIAPQQKGNA